MASNKTTTRRKSAPNPPDFFPKPIKKRKKNSIIKKNRTFAAENWSVGLCRVFGFNAVKIENENLFV